jgi:hypothetical protein
MPDLLWCWHRKRSEQSPKGHASSPAVLAYEGQFDRLKPFRFARGVRFIWEAVRQE